MAYLRLLILCMLPLAACCQDFVYVNTDNLILRDRPKDEYMVFSILHAPCKLKVEPYDSTYRHNKKVKDKFYRVSISYTDSRNFRNFVFGWVEKRYVVNNVDKVNAKGIDKSLELNESDVIIDPEDTEGEIVHLNFRQFPGPKYKGGVNPPIAVRRTFHKGPNGGCYYINKHGRKIYVDKSFCGQK